jgi:hypothetical protein
MKRIDLDFVARRRSPWAGRVLLALAVAFSADVALSYRQAQSVLDATTALASRSETRTPQRRASAEEVAQVRDTLTRLSLPWDKLFGALESASSERIALLGVEPDSKAGTVVITGDSKDYLAALSYVLELSHSDSLSKVQLVRHELKASDPQRPVAFTVTARWNGARQ